MKRRELLGTVGIGSAALITSASALRATAGTHQDHEAVEGPLANATVSFGGWPANNLDRTVLPAAPAAPNAHQLIPQTAKIKVGGSVNFIVAGFHQILVYAPGTSPGDISLANGIPIPGAPPAVFLINDPRNRVFRGVSPLTVGQDRVEVVQFRQAGVYLVMCAVSVHFADGMFGWVRVLSE